MKDNFESSLPPSACPWLLFAIQMRAPAGWQLPTSPKPWEKTALYALPVFVDRREAQREQRKGEFKQSHDAGLFEFTFSLCFLCKCSAPAVAKLSILPLPLIVWKKYTWSWTPFSRCFLYSLDPPVHMLPPSASPTVCSPSARRVTSTWQLLSFWDEALRRAPPRLARFLCRKGHCPQRHANVLQGQWPFLQRYSHANSPTTILGFGVPKGTVNSDKIPDSRCKRHKSWLKG